MLAIAEEKNILFDFENKKIYEGTTSYYGIGTPGIGGYGGIGYTYVTKYLQFNVFEIAETVYVKLMEW